MIRIWLSEEQAESVLALVYYHLSKFGKLSVSENKQKWAQIYDMLNTQIEEQKKSDDI